MLCISLTTMACRLRSNKKFLSAQRPKSCGMLGYSDATSSVASRTSEGKSIMLRILLIKSSVSSVNNEPPMPSQSCGKSRCKLCLSLICSNYIRSTANNKTFKCYNKNTSCDSKWIIYVISCPICDLQYVGQSNNFRARMNGHKSDFRLYAAGKTNKMDNKLLYNHLI